MAEILYGDGDCETDWLGKYWPRWSEVLREAGFAPNQLTSAYGETELVERYIALVRKLGAVPATADLRMETRSTPDFRATRLSLALGLRQSFCRRYLTIADPSKATRTLSVSARHINLVPVRQTMNGLQ